MRPFDIEAARRGAPIEAKFNGNWVDAEFVGIHRGLAVVYVNSAPVSYAQWTECHLRMKPKRRTVWINLHKGGQYYTHESAESAHEGADNGHGQRASEILASAVLVEIEE